MAVSRSRKRLLLGDGGAVSGWKRRDPGRALSACREQDHTASEPLADTGLYLLILRSSNSGPRMSALGVRRGKAALICTSDSMSGMWKRSHG